MRILTIDRPNSVEVKIFDDAGKLLASRCAVYRPDLGRYYPAVDEVYDWADRQQADAQARGEQVVVEGLQR